jgi:CheY-like chemotaxis protein
MSTSKLIKNVCQKKNLDCHTAIFHNGIECLYNIYQESLKNKFFDILFIDETMPFIRGSLVTKVLKNMINEKQLNDLLIYVVTSYEDDYIINAINATGCDGVIQKPISKEMINKILEKNNFK